MDNKLRLCDIKYFPLKEDKQKEISVEKIIELAEEMKCNGDHLVDFYKHWKKSVPEALAEVNNRALDELIKKIRETSY